MVIKLFNLIAISVQPQQIYTCSKLIIGKDERE